MGIAGHKNSYSTKVRNGNWVEDEFGGFLAARGGIPTGPPVSETRASHIRPEKMSNTACRGEPVINQVAISSERLGLPYALLFGHGLDNGKQSDVERTMPSNGPPVNDKIRQKINELDFDKRVRAHIVSNICLPHSYKTNPLIAPRFFADGHLRNHKCHDSGATNAAVYRSFDQRLQCEFHKKFCPGCARFEKMTKKRGGDGRLKRGGSAQEHDKGCRNVLVQNHAHNLGLCGQHTNTCF